MAKARGNPKKAAQATHAAHPAGRQTPKQLASERANLVKARAALAQQRGLATTAAIDVKGVALTVEGAKLGVLAAKRVETNPGALGKHHALGTREVAIKLGRPKMPPKRKNLLGIGAIHRPTGIFKKVPRRVAPGSFLSRTGWRHSRAHHLKHHLRLRKHRPAVVKHWRRRRHGLRPR